jgi:hypothetical protein
MEIIIEALAFLALFISGILWAVLFEEKCQQRYEDAQARVDARVLAIQQGKY